MFSKLITCLLALPWSTFVPSEYWIASIGSIEVIFHVASAAKFVLAMAQCCSGLCEPFRKTCMMTSPGSLGPMRTSTMPWRGLETCGEKSTLIAGLAFGKSRWLQPPPGGPPPKGAPRDIGPIATASGLPTKARPPPKPTRPAPSPPKAASKPATAPKAEPASASASSVKREPSSTASASSVKREPSSTASASSVKREPSPTAPEPAPKVEEPAPVKEEKIGMPPGLVDELQTMSPAQKKARCY